MAEYIRWGIIGCGSIAAKFAEGLKKVPGSILSAVASRSEQKARRFGEKRKVARCYGSYKSLAADPDVDVVYIATPHPMHMENCMLCLNAGKAVLCEKPFTVNAAQVKDVVSLARSRSLFLMEAMWTRFLPSITKLREILSQGLIGDIRLLQADFGFRTDLRPDSRLFNPELGGGALLDVGIYNVSFASMVFGRQPSRISSIAHIGETGVDEQSGIVFGYENGEIAVLTSAVRTATYQEALIAGADGQIKLNGRWWGGSPFTLSVAGRKPEQINPRPKGNGYNYEAEEVAGCLRSGKLESEIMPLDESVRIMETMDRIRKQWDLKYPFELEKD